MTCSIDTNSGFCFGVTSAIEKAEQELKKGPLYCLGDIVHNGQECARLEQQGLRTIDYDDLRTLHRARVLLRAHGEPPSTYWIAEQRGLEIVDATCPVVKKLQDRIRACYEQHKADEPLPPQIVIYGKPGHAEVIGLEGQTNNTAIVIESVDEIERLDFTRPIYLFSQTTKSVDGFNGLVEAIKAKGEGLKAKGERLEANSIFEYHDTICRNVANRVARLQDFAREQDLVIFVGGKKSSNARVLYNKCKEANENTVFVSSPDELAALLPELNIEKTNPDYRVGICGATSTPLWLMEACKKLLT